MVKTTNKGASDIGMNTDYSRNPNQFCILIFFTRIFLERLPYTITTAGEKARRDGVEWRGNLYIFRQWCTARILSLLPYLELPVVSFMEGYSPVVLTVFSKSSGFSKLSNPAVLSNKKRQLSLLSNRGTMNRSVVS